MRSSSSTIRLILATENKRQRTTVERVEKSGFYFNPTILGICTARAVVKGSSLVPVVLLNQPILLHTMRESYA